MPRTDHRRVICANAQQIVTGCTECCGRHRCASCRSELRRGRGECHRARSLVQEPCEFDRHRGLRDRLGLCIVFHADVERQRLADPDGHRRRRAASRPLCLWSVRYRHARWRVVGRRLAFDRIDLPVRPETSRDRVRLSAHAECPDQLLLAEIRRHLHREDPPVPSRREVGGLSLIGRSRRDEVAGANRDVHFFLLVAVEIPKRKAEGAIAVLVPALEGRRDRLPAWAERSERLLRTNAERRSGHSKNE